MEVQSKILAVVHHGASDLGRVGPILRDAGCVTEICWPAEGDRLPGDLSDYAGVIIFGGVMGAFEDHLAHIRAELDWIPNVLDADCPLFGICLGSQLIAQALGGRAYKQPQGRWEIGYNPVEPTPAGAPFLPNGRQNFYFWHQDGFDVPPGGELLGTGGDAFPNQMFRVGTSAFGVQFHPEAPSALFTSWMDKVTEDFESRPGAHTRARQERDAALYEDAADAWLVNFLQMWLQLRQPQARACTG